MGLTDASIIAFVVYPLTYSNDSTGISSYQKHKVTHEEFSNKVKSLLKEFNIPSFMLGVQQDMSKLCQMIIDFFDYLRLLLCDYIVAYTELFMALL